MSEPFEKIFSTTVRPNPPPAIKQRASNIYSGVTPSLEVNVATYAKIITFNKVNKDANLFDETSEPFPNKFIIKFFIFLVFVTNKY